MPLDQPRVYTQQIGLHPIAVHQKTADEIIRATRDGGDLLTQHSSGAAFSDAEGRATLAQHVSDNGFEQVAVPRINAVAEQRFDRRTYLVKQASGFFLG